MSFLDIMRLVRYKNLLIVAITQLLVYFCLIEVKLFVKPDPVILILIIATLFVTAAGYVINDYYDIEADKINRGDKIVVDRLIGRKQAFILWIILSVIALSLSLFAGLNFLLYYFIVVFLLFLYACKIKRMPLAGNILVSALLSLTLVILWLYKTGPYLGLLLLYSVFAFFTGLIREILKDLEDMEGDEAAGFHTFPILFGAKVTKRLVSLLILALIGGLIIFSLLIYQYYQYWAMMVYMLVFVLIPASLSLYLVQTAKEKNDYEQLTRYMKFIVFMGSSSMLLLLL